MSVHSEKTKLKNLILSCFDVRGQVCQKVNITDKSLVGRQAFQGGAPNDLFCSFLLCKHSVPLGRIPAPPLAVILEGQGQGGGITTIQTLSELMFAFPLVPAPNPLLFTSVHPVAVSRAFCVQHL